MDIDNSTAYFKRCPARVAVYYSLSSQTVPAVDTLSPSRASPDPSLFFFKPLRAELEYATPGYTGDVWVVLDVGGEEIRAGFPFTIVGRNGSPTNLRGQVIRYCGVQEGYAIFHAAGGVAGELLLKVPITGMEAPPRPSTLTEKWHSWRSTMSCGCFSPGTVFPRPPPTTHTLRQPPQLQFGHVKVNHPLLCPPLTLVGLQAPPAGTGGSTPPPLL